MIGVVKTELEKIKRTAFGISVPELRKYAKRIANDECETFLKCNDYESFELRLLHAFVIGYAKSDIAVLLKYVEAFIPYVDSWQVCDSLCQNFKIARRHPKTVWDFLMQYKDSESEFESRIVSVMLLSHYLNDAYIDDVIAVLDVLKTNDYYSQMGVAWAIATVMAKYPEKCLEYLSSKTCHLNTITYNMSIRKMRESFRVSDEVKERVKGMVRKNIK